MQGLLVSSLLFMLLCTASGPAARSTVADVPPSAVNEAPASSVAVPPPGSTVVVMGDSVPERLLLLEDRFKDVLGWRTVNVARTGCPIFGGQTAWPDGTAKRAYSWCQSVRSVQAAALAEEPEVVVWWDRLSLVHYLTGPEDGGEFVYAGSDRFWDLRHDDLRKLASEVVASGALLVFVRTEPMGIGVKRPCPTWHESRQCWDFLRFRTRHYTDITRRWNAMMKRWANHHPGEAVYVNITDDICVVDESPCDDRIDGVPARDDGSHYAEAGERKAARVVVREIRTALRWLT